MTHKPVKFYYLKTLFLILVLTSIWVYGACKVADITNTERNHHAPSTPAAQPATHP